MNIRTRARRLLLIIIASTLALVAAPVASASTAPPALTATQVSPYGMESCSSGRVCRWSGTNYSGTMTTASSVGTVINVSGTWKSLYVNRGGAVVFYSGSGGSGTPVCFGPGRTAPSLSGWQASPGSIKLLASGCP